MNLVSINSRSLKSGVSPIRNQKNRDNPSLFEKGNTFSARVLGGSKNTFLLETFGGVKFETSFSSVQPNVGDTLNFEVVGSENGNVALKLLHNVAPSVAQGGANQMSDDDLMELFKQSNFVKEYDTCPSEHDYDDLASQQEENLKISQAVSRIQSQISYATNNLGLSAINELLASGISIDKISMEVLNSVLQEVEANPNVEIPEKELNSIIDKHIDKHNFTKEGLEQKADIAKELIYKEMPITDKNIENVEKAIKTFNDIKDLDDPTIIYALKEELPLTLSNLYLFKYSAKNTTQYKDTLNDEIWNNLKTEINKMLENEKVEKTKENIDIAKLLVANEIPIAKDNVDLVTLLRNLKDNVSVQNIISDSIVNIRKDIPTTNIELKNAAYYKDKQNLSDTYKAILKDLPSITPKLIVTLEDINKPVTLFNLRNALYGDINTDEGLQVRANDITYKKELAEIQLKLTHEAAVRLVGKNINIDTMPLTKVVEELRILEKEAYGKTLALVGAEASTQNVERMQTLYDNIANFKPLASSVFSDIINNKTPFSIDGISTSNTLAKAVEGYETFSTTPNAKYGDSFSAVYGQLSNVLETLGIDPTQADIKAASILSRNKIDINNENLMQVKVIDEKINYVQNTLHPHIAANLIKDGLNPLNMHIDEVISYIKGFNNEYGDNLRDKIANHILEMDLKKELSKEERASMVAIYRTLNEIQRNDGASLGLNIKAGHNPTLGHLLDASNYYTRTHGNYSYSDVSIDDKFGATQNLNVPENNIRSLLNSTYQAETKSNVARIEALLQSNENVTPLMVNELTYNEMLFDSVAQKLNSDIFAGMLNSNKNILDTPLAELIQKIENLETESEYAEKSLERSKAVLEDIKNILNFNPHTAHFLEQNNIPKTLVNIQTMGMLFKKPGYVGDILNNALEQTEDNALTDLIPQSPIEYIGENSTLSESLNNVSDNLGNLIFEDIDKNLIKDIRLAQNAIKVQNLINHKQESYSIPIKLHDKITSLNMYVPKGTIPTDGNINVAISINTPKFGPIGAYIKAEGTNLLMYLNTQDNAILDLLKDNEDMLTSIFNESGFSLNSIIYNEELENTDDIYNRAANKTDTSKNTKKQMFDLATSLTKYLDKL